MLRWFHFAIFFSIVIAIYGGAHFYVYLRLVSALGPLPAGALWAIRLAAALLVLSFPAGRILAHQCSNPAAAAFELASSVWMGLFMYLFFITLGMHLAAAALRLAGLWPLPAGRFGIESGRFWVFCAAALTLAVSVLAFIEANSPPRITEIVVPVKRLPANLEGFTIVQISDAHIGAIIGSGRLDRIAERINSLDPDLVVITGDLVDETAEREEKLAGPLGRIKARHGVLAVTGNHEVYAGVEEAVKQAAAGGVRFLRNEKITIAGAIVVYGVDDPAVGRRGIMAPEIEGVIGPEAMETPAILLQHQPVGFEKAASLGIDLMLSGHTHRGQLWPMSHLSRLVYPFQSGRYSIGESTLFVTTGVGTWGPPMRLGSPPEIVKITLTARHTDAEPTAAREPQ